MGRFAEIGIGLALLSPLVACGAENGVESVSAAQHAAAAACQKTAIETWEDNNVTFDAQTIAGLANLLGITIERLAHGENGTIVCDPDLTPAAIDRHQPVMVDDLLCSPVIKEDPSAKEILAICFAATDYN